MPGEIFFTGGSARGASFSEGGAAATSSLFRCGGSGIPAGGRSRDAGADGSAEKNPLAFPSGASETDSLGAAGSGESLSDVRFGSSEGFATGSSGGATGSASGGCCSRAGSTATGERGCGAEDGASSCGGIRDASFASATIFTVKIVWPPLISSPLASMASWIRAPFKNVPLLLLRSWTRQPPGPHSTAKCTPDMNVSCGKANCARPAARPNVTVCPVAMATFFPVIGPSRISSITPTRCSPKARSGQSRILKSLKRRTKRGCSRV
jgi:hypothetical protein